MKVWKTWTGPSRGGRAWSNLHCLKSYKIRNTITNFQKLNFKNEVYLTLKNESLYSLYFIVKNIGFRAYETSESRRTKVSL